MIYYYTGQLNMKGEVERFKLSKLEGCGILHNLHVYTQFCLSLNCKISCIEQNWTILKEILLNG